MTCVSSYIIERYRPLRGAPKILARLSGASHQTTERWLRGEADPSWHAVVRLARADEGMRAIIMREIGEGIE